MPLYVFKCEKCGNKLEVVQGLTGAVPLCCGKGMARQPTSPAVIIMRDALGNRGYSKGYKDGYAKEYRRDTPPFVPKRKA